MNYRIDEERQEIIIDEITRVPLYSPEGFRIISELWVKVGWDQKHMYTFSWLGRPLIQIPEDAFRIQEVIYQIKPDVVIETGVAHGGSLIFYASIFKAIGKGRVIGVDIEIRPHNRTAIENHELSPWIILLEGDSTAQIVLDQVERLISRDDKVLVILDSNHSYQHVFNELVSYNRFVTKGSYIVATDGSQQYLNETPRAKREYPHCSEWPKDNPKCAAEDFVKQNPQFRICEPDFLFNESQINFRVTHWPSAFIQRI